MKSQATVSTPSKTFGDNNRKTAVWAWGLREMHASMHSMMPAFLCSKCGKQCTLSHSNNCVERHHNRLGSSAAFAQLSCRTQQ